MNRVKKTFSRIHNGEVYKITTDEGCLTATDEHPLLSNESWVAAKSLKNGDNLTSVCEKVIPLSFAELESLDYPSYGFEIFRLFAVLKRFLGRVVPVPAIYLNGKFYICKGEVDGKNSYNKVWDRVLSLFKKGAIEQELVFGPCDSFIKFCSFDGLFVCDDTSSDSFVGSIDMRFKSVLIKPGYGLAHIQRLESIFNQIPVDTASGNPELFSYLIGSEILLTEQLDKHFLFDIDFSTHSTAIVDVTCCEVKQKVYNIEIENTHTFIANNFISHNCGCYLMPVLRDQDTFVDDLARWANGESVDYLDDWNDSYYGMIA